MRDRTFGVEIECGAPSGTEGVRDAFAAAGMLVPGRGEWYSENFNLWSFGHDGSGVEVRTPILRGEAGFSQLRRGLEILNTIDAYVSTADGLHVHHGVPELVGNPPMCYQLVRSWKNNEQNIHAFVDERRHTSGWCQTWQEDQIEAILTGTADRREFQSQPHPAYNYAEGRYMTPAEYKAWYTSTGPRGSVNLGSLEDLGTVEFRLHEGTLDPDQIEAWVRFGQRFINNIVKRKKPMPAVESPEALLKRVRVAKRAAAQLERRAKGEAQTVLNTPSYDDYYDDGWDYDPDW